MRLLHADSREVLTTLEPASIDAVVTDPPYQFDGGFMGQSWDRNSGAFDPTFWELVRAVTKPGSYVAAFGGRRTWHRLAVALEDAGLEIRDTLMWLYTTGNVTAKDTTLKPAWEPIVLAQVPSKRSLKATVEEHGTGYLQIDESRIPYLDADDLAKTQAKNPGRTDTVTSGVYGTGRAQQMVNSEGRHPSNVLVDEYVAEALGRERRFFPCPKASRRERDAGLSIEQGIARNPHTCVKPVAMMAWLVRLLCPPGGIVLDPFAGSGTTGVAAVDEGREFIGIEREEIYAQTMQLRVAHARSTTPIEEVTNA